MSEKEQKIKNEERKSPFIVFTEIMGWLQIAASPFLISVLIGAVVYFSNSTDTGLAIAILIVAAGLITGIVWATRIWKKRGTIDFISGISKTPETDNVDSELKN